MVAVSRHDSRLREFTVPESAESLIRNYFLEVQSVTVSELSDESVARTITAFLPIPAEMAPPDNPDEEDLSSCSPDFWLRILLQCVDLRCIRDKEMTKFLEELPAHSQHLEFRHTNTWSFALYGSRPAAYWGPKIQKDPLVALPLPQSCSN